MIMAKKTLIEEKWDEEETQPRAPTRVASNFVNG